MFHQMYALNLKDMFDVFQTVIFYVIFFLELITCDISTTVKTCMTRPYVERWEKEYYPNPQNDTQEDYCGRGCKSSWVCDPGRVITMDEADDLDHKIEDIRTVDPCGCSTCIPGTDGFTISIALIPNMYIPKRQDKKDIRNIATTFLNYLRNTTWQFGSCNNDVIILLSTKQKLVQLDAGKSVRIIIPEECLNNIQDEAVDSLLSNDTVFDVLDCMITRLGHAVQDKTCTLPGPKESLIVSHDATILIIVGAIILIVIIMLISFYLKRQGHCKRMKTYRIKLPAMTLRVRKSRKHHEPGSEDEMTHMKPADSKEGDDIHVT